MGQAERIVFPERFCSVSPAPATALTPLLLPTGTEYHVDMNRKRKRCSDAEDWDRSARSDVLLGEQPDEEDDEEEDEPNGTGDEEDDAGEDDGGYSVQVYSLCQSDR